ncbi:MAG: Na(+)/H(+) antiporter subunit B [Gammaproteobacteria bacterium]|nr:Na(+)/H(+) antiporter subunit B [Gammaproteobacteria bacterium]
MIHHLVLRIVAKLLVPFILLFALYVQFHGEYSPGGGFQAGVIFAAGFILYGLIYGVDQYRQVISPDWLRRMAALGVLLYIGVGLTTLLMGGNFLDYDVLADHAIQGQHMGILLVELGVGITVATVMMSLFMMFAKP